MKKVLSTILVLSLFILTGCSAATKDTIRTVETVKGKIEIPAHVELGILPGIEVNGLYVRILTQLLHQVTEHGGLAGPPIPLNGNGQRGRAVADIAFQALEITADIEQVFLLPVPPDGKVGYAMTLIAHRGYPPVFSMFADGRALSGETVRREWTPPFRLFQQCPNMTPVGFLPDFQQGQREKDVFFPLFHGLRVRLAYRSAKAGPSFALHRAAVCNSRRPGPYRLGCGWRSPSQ